MGREVGPFWEWLEKSMEGMQYMDAVLLSCGLNHVAPGALPRRRSGAHRTSMLQAQGAQRKSPIRR